MADWESFYRRARALRARADTLRDVIKNEKCRTDAVDKEYLSLVEQFEFLNEEMREAGANPKINPHLTEHVSVITLRIQDFDHFYATHKDNSKPH